MSGIFLYAAPGIKKDENPLNLFLCSLDKRVFLPIFTRKLMDYGI